MDKEDETFIYRHDSVFKKKEILQFTATWVNVEDILPYEINQTQKDKSCMILFTCGISKS